MVHPRPHGSRRRRLPRPIRHWNQNMARFHPISRHSPPPPERCRHSPESFTDSTQRGPRERESRYPQSALQRPGDSTHIPHLPAHTASTPDTGSITTLSGWDAATTTNQQITIQTTDEHNPGVRRGKWRETLREKGLPALREWVPSPTTGPEESKNRSEKHWQHWEKYILDPLNTLSVEGPVTSKKAKGRPPIQSKEPRSAHSPQSSDTGYDQRYHFSPHPPTDHQRQQTLKQKRSTIDNEQ